MRTLRAAVLLTALWLVAAPATAGAHTEVLRAEPQPGTDVSGTVEEVRLTFLDPVQPGTTIEVADDTGQPVAGLGQAEQSADGRSASVRFEPLSAGGGYVVEYRFTAQDGDEQVESYRFTYRPTALGSGGGGRGGDGGDGLRTDAAGIGAAAVFAAALVLGAATALARRTRTTA